MQRANTKDDLMFDESKGDAVGFTGNRPKSHSAHNIVHFLEAVLWFLVVNELSTGKSALRGNYWESSANLHNSVKIYKR